MMFGVNVNRLIVKEYGKGLFKLFSCIIQCSIFILLDGRIVFENY